MHRIAWRISVISDDLGSQSSLLFALTPPVFYVIAWICTWFYPLSEERMVEVRAELDARKARSIADGMVSVM